MEQKDGNCHKMSQILFDSALRTARRREKAGKLAKPAVHSLGLPGGVWQARWGVSKVGRADFGSALRMCLPSRSEQRA